MNSVTESVEITPKGIRKVLNKYTPQRAIAEYIWNGFDAHATEVRVSTTSEKVYDSIIKISVNDNGEGIVYEQLPVVFKKFYESHKSIKGNVDSRFSRGKNGYGRFTFFKFAEKAEWDTVYKKDECLYKYNIDINAQKLTDYNPTAPEKCTEPSTGTTVVFTNINNDDLSTPGVKEKLIPFLTAEFAWYFKVYPERRLYINGTLLDCSSVIADSEVFDLPIKLDGVDDELFHIYFFQWSAKPQDEYSRFYFMSADGDLKYQKTTLYNNKGDCFWHSVLIKSTFFNSLTDIEDDDEHNLFSSLPERRVFKALKDRLNEYLGKKRRPFLRAKAEVLIDNFESEDLFSFIGKSPWEEERKKYLQFFIKELFEVEPAVFTKLNSAQKRIFIRLLDQVMDTDHNESLFKILGELVDLEEDDKDRFAKILATTKLKNIVATIQLIEDRLETIKALKLINFDHSLKAGEVKHLQKLIEHHYWIFGEEYRFVCAEEVRFQEALNRYKYFLHGVTEKEYVEHPDKYKEMDLFITGQDFKYSSPSNLVVEIKSPTSVPKLNMSHYSQINTYMNVIRKQEGFNDPNTSWTFILIGLSIDDVAEQQIKEPLTGLCIKKDNYSLYMKTWAQVLNEADSRFKYLKEKMEIVRDNLVTTDFVDDIVEKVINNSAAAGDVK
jgi:hypothetical protein